MKNQRTLSLVLYYLYLCLLVLFFPIFIIRVYYRQLFHLKRQGKGRGRLRERLGVFGRPELNHPIWVHAVSYGEAVLAERLVTEIKTQFPQRDIVVTTTTMTGSIHIQKKLGGQVFHVFLPYDLPFFVRAFIKKIKPCLLVPLETELWPVLLKECRKAGIPIFLANARLSEKSLAHYRYIRPLVSSMLDNLTLVAAQTEEDAKRFLQLGLSSEKIRVMGSIKYDLKVPDGVIQQGRALREALGQERFIWTAGSTHEGEELKVLEVFRLLKKKCPEIILILAPRHPERFDVVASLCLQRGYRVVRRTVNSLPSQPMDIFLGDTLGELLSFYAASNVAFVGGSLVPVGGHNVLEAIAVNCPVIIGSYFQNFKGMIDALKEKNGIEIVSSSDELAEKMMDLMDDPEKSKVQVRLAQAVLRENQGALARHLRWIGERSRG